MASNYREAKQVEKLRRIAEMMSVREAKGDLKDRQATLKGLTGGEVVTLFVNNVMAEDVPGWLGSYDFIVRPFSLHLFRIYPKADSLSIPEDFGEWNVVDHGRINGNPAFKLERFGAKVVRRVGFFDTEEFCPREKAIVVIRFSEGLVEVRAPYEIAKDIGEMLKRKMRLDDAVLVVLNVEQYRRLLENLRAAFDKIVYGASVGSAAEISVKMRAGHTIAAGTEVAFEMGPQDGGPGERIDDSSLLRNAGWATITLGNRAIKGQVYRTRGTFAANALLSEQEVDVVVAAFKQATGLGL